MAVIQRSRRVSSGVETRVVRVGRVPALRRGHGVAVPGHRGNLEIERVVAAGGSAVIYTRLLSCPSRTRIISSQEGESGPVQVLVRDNNVDQALKALKKKMQREGVFREMKLRRHYEKPSERRAREAAEAVRRARKVERKRLEREGF